MKFNENSMKGSGDMERTQKCYGRNNGRTDEGHSYIITLIRFAAGD